MSASSWESGPGTQGKSGRVALPVRLYIARRIVVEKYLVRAAGGDVVDLGVLLAGRGEDDIETVGGERRLLVAIRVGQPFPALRVVDRHGIDIVEIRFDPGEGEQIAQG